MDLKKSELDSEIILSECRIVGALEGTRLELGVRLVTLQLTGTIQQFRTSRTTGAGLLNTGKSLETRTNASKPWPHSRNTCCNSICIAQKDGLLDAFTFQDYNWKRQQVDVCTVTRSTSK